eukprot:COSAG01_NODE_11301_length_1963_cov_8.909335_4_plen_78_part_00
MQAEQARLCARHAAVVEEAAASHATALAEAEARGQAELRDGEAALARAHDAAVEELEGVHARGMRCGVRCVLLGDCD